jgi:sugar-specific transcriptional regulator TrmB
MGRFSILALSQKTGIKRPTCYLIVEELIKKGLLSSFPKAKKTIYIAEHPSILIRNSETIYKLSKTIAPELQNIMNVAFDKPILKVFVGQKGLQNIFEDFIYDNKQKVIYYISSVSEMITAVGESYLRTWIDQRIKKGIKTVSIRIRDKERKEELFSGTHGALRELKYAPEGFYIPYSVHIYDKKVAFISTKKDMFGFVVESEDFAKTIRVFFDFIWSMSKEK